MTDIDYNQAADAIRNLGKLFRHMEGAADALSSIGSLEQAAGEKRRILTDLDAKIDAAKLAIGEHTAEADRIAVENSAKAAGARAHADSIVDEAQASAATINAKAQVDAATLMTKARQDADNITADAKLAAGRAAVDRDACAAQAKELQASVSAKTNELDALQSRITAAKAQIAKMLGE